MEAIICVGLPASGKTTIYKKYFSLTHFRINLDMLKTRKRETALFVFCIKHKLKLYIDNTNVTKKERKNYISKLIVNKYKVRCFWFDTDMEVCISRNENRKGSSKVEPVAIYSKNGGFEEPEDKEGFDNILRFTLSKKEENPNARASE